MTFDDADDQLVVSDVERNSLASRIGLREGDEVLSVNGRRIGSEREFYRWIGQSQPGRRIPVEISRDGDRQTVYWTGQQQGVRDDQIGSRQAQFNAQGQAFLGVQLDQRFPNAAVVRDVYDNSPAEHAGLKPGDWIVAINGQRISSSQDLTNEVSQLEPGSAVQIQISRPTTQNMQVRLGDRGDASRVSFEEGGQSYQTGSRDESSQQRGSARGSRATGSFSDDNQAFESGSFSQSNRSSESEDDSNEAESDDRGSADDDSDDRPANASAGAEDDPSEEDPGSADDDRE